MKENDEARQALEARSNKEFQENRKLKKEKLENLQQNLKQAYARYSGAADLNVFDPHVLPLIDINTKKLKESIETMKS